nr:Dihydrofolate reductase [uncultured bacterium]
MIHAIVAMTDSRVIGKRNALPWKLKGDLPRFKKLTSGHTVIMGRNTYESIGRPLPNRHNIVLDFDQRPIEGAVVCDSITEALRVARSYGTEIFVIGGASIYEQMLPYVEVLHISHVKQDYEGDVSFPTYDTVDWKEVEREDFEDFTAVTYERQSTPQQISL